MTRQTKYQELATTLADQIHTGAYPPGSRLPTETELMAEFDVSRQTVLHGLKQLVNKGMIQRIQGSGSYVREHAGLTGTIILVYAGNPERMTSNPVDIELLHGINHAVAQTPFALRVQLLQNPKPTKADFDRLDAMINHDVQGIILVSHTSPNADKVAAFLAAKSLPAVSIAQCYKGPKMDSVVSLDEEGTVRAIEYLFALGHQRIGFVTTEVGGQASFAREDGYKRAIEEFGGTYDETLFITFDDNHEALHANLAKALKHKNPPTAIMVMHDRLAVFVMSILSNRMRLSIPQDISVMGYDDIPQVSLLSPPLTTMAVPRNEMAEAACQALFERIENPEIAPKTITFKAELMKRGSCAPGPGWIRK